MRRESTAPPPRSSHCIKVVPAGHPLDTSAAAGAAAAGSSSRASCCPPRPPAPRFGYGITFAVSTACPTFAVLADGLVLADRPPGHDHAFRRQEVHDADDPLTAPLGAEPAVLGDAHPVRDNPKRNHRIRCRRKDRRAHRLAVSPAHPLEGGSVARRRIADAASTYSGACRRFSTARTQCRERQPSWHALPTLPARSRGSRCGRTGLPPTLPARAARAGGSRGARAARPRGSRR